MRRSWVLGALCALWLAIPLVAPPRAFSAQTSEQRGLLSPPHKFALLVGIDDYHSPGPNGDDLYGCKKDLIDIRRAIVHELGFPDDDEHISELKDQAATRDAIIGAIKAQLIANAQKYPDGTFFFHYSGHGSQMFDSNSNEPDKMDECMVAADHRPLRDKEINGLLKQLSSYTPNTIFVFDCCHSATMTRSGGSTGARTRYMAPDHLVKTSLSADTGDPGTISQNVPAAGKLSLPTSAYVAFSACMASQNEDETREPDLSQHNGVLTRYLVNSLKQARSNWSYEDLHNATCSAISSGGWSTLPQLEGDRERLMFKSGSKRADPYISVKAASGRTLTINAGADMGWQRLGRDAIVAVYDKDAEKLSGKHYQLAEGTVASIGPLTSEVIIDKDLDHDKLLAAKVVLATPGYASTPLKVALDASVPKDSSWPNAQAFVADLQAALGKDEEFSLSTMQGDPSRIATGGFDVAVIRDSYENFTKGRHVTLSRGPRPRRPEDSVYFLTSPDGRPLFDVCVSPGEQGGEDKLMQALRKRAAQQALVALSNETTDLKGRLQIRIVKVDQYEFDANHRPVVKRSHVIDGPLALREGDTFQFQITNNSEVDLYPTILDLGTSGSISVIYPPEGAGSKALPQGGTFTTDIFKESGPAGRETFKIIATTQPEDFTFLQQSGMKRSALRGGAENTSPLRQFLLNSVARTRDSQPLSGPLDINDFTVSTTAIDVN